jgi:hypothetical protein
MKIIRAINFRKKTYSPSDCPPVWRKIIAAGLGGIIQQMINNEQWGIISVHSDRDELKDYLRQKGIGFIQMQGTWVIEKVQKFIPEESLLIPKVAESFVQAIASKYSQDVYIFAQNNKYFIKDTESGKIEIEGNVKEHFKQFQSPRDKFQFDTENIIGQRWIMDKNLQARSKLIAAEMDEQNSHILRKAKLKLKIPKALYAFIVWKKRPKYVGWEGIMVEDPDSLIPPGSPLTAFFPLMLSNLHQG